MNNDWLRLRKRPWSEISKNTEKVSKRPTFHLFYNFDKIQVFGLVKKSE